MAPVERLTRVEVETKAHREMISREIAALGTLINERLDALNERFNERCSSCVGRIESLEQSSIRLGERMGKLEALQQRHEGGWWVVTKFLAAGAVLGGMAIKFFEGFRGQ